MTIQHFAFAKFKEGLSQTKKDELFDTAYNLITPITGVKGFRVGPPVTLSLTQGFDFALSAEFDTIEAFKHYQTHPDHTKLLNLLREVTDAEKGILSYQIDFTELAKL